ncbi:microsomal glutathione S-transferase 1-like [Tribolium madens]|uniref:microsomal glutathione S-transferase 1-like n=1 Tax=Tribolium madens TaxID=41895 RepID=UPI001CF726DD|nr:microsomal glutathione S-transferase 1-like [Tribolium madens]
MTNATDKMVVEEILSLKNPVFCSYLISSCFLVVKMILLAFFTGYKRAVHKAYLSPEDADFNKGQVKTHDEVERIRRAHLNDLENIPIFWTSAFAYLWTKPSITVACFLYFGFVVIRTFHTIVYAFLAAPQPTRAILFTAGVAIVIYMSIHSIVVGFQNLA